MPEQIQNQPLKASVVADSIETEIGESKLPEIALNPYIIILRSRPNPVPNPEAPLKGLEDYMSQTRRDIESWVAENHLERELKITKERALVSVFEADSTPEVMARLKGERNNVILKIEEKLGTIRG